VVVKSGPEGASSHVADAFAYLALAFFGSALNRGDTLERYKRQSAYSAPWNGAPEGTQSPNPAFAGSVYAKSIGYNAEAWRKQYER
jgi:hypothetical protein